LEEQGKQAVEGLSPVEMGLQAEKMC